MYLNHRREREGGQEREEEREIEFGIMGYYPYLHFNTITILFIVQMLHFYANSAKTMLDRLYFFFKHICFGIGAFQALSPLHYACLRLSQFA